jgi:preprotein translocase subunit YajC
MSEQSGCDKTFVQLASIICATVVVIFYFMTSCEENREREHSKQIHDLQTNKLDHIDPF